MSAPSLSLYTLSDELATWLDSLELTAPDSPERLECEEEIRVLMQDLPAKVDSVSWTLAHLESQAKLAACEIKRLQSRKQACEAALERLEGYCVDIIAALPEPRRGARKLEGDTSTLSIRSSDAVIIEDEVAIPADYKSTYIEIKVRKDDIKRALKAGKIVPGADLAFRNNLVRR